MLKDGWGHMTLLHPASFHLPNTHCGMDGAIFSTSSEYEQKYQENLAINNFNI